MLRLILLVMFLLVLALGALLALAVLRWISGPAPSPKEDTVPDTFRRVAHLVLIVLMFGVTSGALGAG